jgi:hypothetical protein
MLRACPSSTDSKTGQGRPIYKKAARAWIMVYVGFCVFLVQQLTYVTGASSRDPNLNL